MLEKQTLEFKMMPKMRHIKLVRVLSLLQQHQIVWSQNSKRIKNKKRNCK
jgi:hypothetical protein